MCRQYCSGGEFRVIVPNMAKSAATLVTFGSDKIIMGYCSELGPIDAQIRLNISGQIQQVSAQSFIDSRNILVQKIEEAQKEHKSPVAYLQQLATLDVAFVNHCERLMNFAKDVGRKWLEKYMLKEKENAKELAKETVNTLCSANEFFSHGRMITGEQIRDNPNIHLEVEILSKDDPYWAMVWELYVRCEVFLSLPPDRPKVKLFESEKSSVTLT